MDSQCVDNGTDDHEDAGSLGELDQASSWSLEMWNAFLDEGDVPLKESQLSPAHFDRLVRRRATSIFEFAQESSNSELSETIQQAVSKLPLAQRRVVQLIFFQSRSTREIARALKISQSAVARLKKRALKNLRSSLVGGGTHFPLNE